MKLKLSVLSGFVLAAGLSSCGLDNDMHFPKIKADITVFEIEGQTSSRIDVNNYTVSVVLGESVDISDLTIKSVKFTETARCSDRNIRTGGKIDLSSPYSLTLSTYQDYEWTITATQPIERYVKAENQTGDATIIAESRKISLTVKTTGSEYDDSRRRLKITDMKLGREGSRVISTTDSNGNVLSIESFPVILDCFYERTFTVDDHGTLSEWSMIVLPAK